jgi:hypothetical protein
MLYRARFRRATLEGVLIVAVLFPIHFFAERPNPTVLSNLAVLLLFFLPPIWGALRLRPAPGPVPWAILHDALFGGQLGLWSGVVGGLEKALLTVLLGESFLIPLSTWLIVAFIFACASALAYAAFLVILRALLGRALGSSVPLGFWRFRRPEQAERTVAYAVISSLIPGVGHYLIDQPQRGARYLRLALLLALLGLFIGTAALVLLVEGRVFPTPLLIAAGLLVISPLPLGGIAAVDLYLAYRRVPASPERDARGGAEAINR